MTPATQASPSQKWNGVTTPSRRGGSGRQLSDVIVELGFIGRDAMDGAISRAQATGSAAERVLLADGALSADQLSRAVAERFGLDHLDLRAFRVDPDAARLVTAAAVRRYHAVPVSFVNDRRSEERRVGKECRSRWSPNP